MPPKPVLANLLAPLQAVPPDLREHVAPDDPVEEPKSEHRPARDGVRPVREVDVRLAAGGRADEGDDEEEDVRGAEEGGCADGEGRRARPVVVGAEVEVYDAEGDDGVDDGEGV